MNRTHKCLRTRLFHGNVPNSAQNQFSSIYCLFPSTPSSSSSNHISIVTLIFTHRQLLMPVVTVAGGKKDFSSFLLILPFLLTITKEKKEKLAEKFFIYNFYCRTTSEMCRRMEREGGGRRGLVFFGEWKSSTIKMTAKEWLQTIQQVKDNEKRKQAGRVKYSAGKAL